jgi:tryptophanyl-tRNA synthetase
VNQIPKGRIFSGMRPSGRLHLGNWLGALKNWVTLQESYECFYCAVDVHALTTIKDRRDTQSIQINVYDLVLDWLAAGIDPDKSVIFVQSRVPDVLTLQSLLSMITPLGWLMRVPTFKERIRQMDTTEDSVSYGLVGYPVLMASDIILYKADTVPVGEDQLPHIELTREIVRRFNSIFDPIFPEPKAVLTESPMILGTDGFSKMSKSLDNHLELAASPEETLTRLRSAFTDPKRLRKSDPGTPEVCNIYKLHSYFNSNQLSKIHNECSNATRGCVDCKFELGEKINESLEEFRHRRRLLMERPNYVRDVLESGADKARLIASETIAEVKSCMGLY